MLTLQYLDAEPLVRGRIKIFSTSEKALGHLRDHVLTRPESYFWCLIVPRFRGLFDPENVNRLARGLSVEPLPTEAQILYDGYCGAITESFQDAILEGWYWAEKQPSGLTTWHTIGRNGVYVVMDERVVRTAHLRAFSRPPDRAGGRQGAKHPLPWAPGRRFETRRGQPGSIPEDTPLARYNLFLKSWDELVISVFGDACLHKRAVPGIGRMQFWRNCRPDYPTWARTRSGAETSAADAAASGEGSHDVDY
jgi:hypothetical protein